MLKKVFVESSENPTTEKEAREKRSNEQMQRTWGIAVEDLFGMFEV